MNSRNNFLNPIKEALEKLGVEEVDRYQKPPFSSKE
jgi:hypothetical protein